jgi:hypothetical protein
MSVSRKQNVIKFQQTNMFLFLAFCKSGNLKSVHPVEIYQHTKFHSPTLTGEMFASISAV